MAVVPDVSQARADLDQICKPVRGKGRSVRALNPLSNQDLELFRAVLRGEHALMGFRNHDIRSRLFPPSHDPETQRRRSARVSRLLKIIHAHSLVAKIPRSRRWRVTQKGHALMSAAVRLATHELPRALAA